MCDYSLACVPSRLAAKGEELEVYRFPSGTTGLASPADVQRRLSLAETPAQRLWQRVSDALGFSLLDQSVAAVCMPPGAFLMLQGIPRKLQKKYAVQEEEGVTFFQLGQLGAPVATHRDALHFQNGQHIRLQDLPVGLRVNVLSLIGMAEFDDGTMAQSRRHADRTVRSSTVRSS